jgi:hypothetical protein
MWKIKRSWTIKGNIVDAIKHLKDPQVKDIKSYLDRKAIEEIEILCSAGKINPDHKFKELKKRQIVRETIQRNLNNLIKSRIIVHKGKTYSIAYITRYSNRITVNPESFAEDLISSLMHFPAHSIEDGIPEMIKRFGIFIGLCFLESVMLRTDNIDSGLPYDKRSAFTAEERDELVLYWVNKVVPIRQMLDLFLSIARIEEERTYDDSNASDYELNKVTVKRVLRAIEKSFPVEYREMSQYRRYWTRKPHYKAG